MTFEEKYGYKLYSMQDPNMKIFVNAIEYLNIPYCRRGSYQGGLVKFLKNNDLLNGDIWSEISFMDLCKMTNGGAIIGIIVVAQQMKRDEIVF